jgi:hypothetical protein
MTKSTNTAAAAQPLARIPPAPAMPHKRKIAILIGLLKGRHGGSRPSPDPDEL